MDAKFIEQLIAIMQRTGLAELHYSKDGETIRLGFGGGIQETSQPEAEPVTPATVPAANDRPQIIEIRAGMAGTFYRAPSPEAEPFVTRGSKVNEGDTLALMEAMKLFVPVEAEAAGTVAEIHAENGVLVDRGVLLFTLQPANPG